MVASTKHIFVTGGVASSLGKGLTASSLGHLLRARGLRVTMQKLDPYLNVDPGTMNPFQHGEVFVTEDGAETDLDIGHYERFLDVDLDGSANVTTGQVYSRVIARERRGEYLGDTVQVIPHITNEIKDRMRAPAAGSPGIDDADAPDLIITEIGGTVGDIESLPFLEAARQVRHDVGRDSCFFLHVSLVPYLAPSGELKTKPTQHSVAALRQVGIQPDALVLRADREIPEDIKRKISHSCDVDEEAVAACVDAPSIYDIPKVLHRERLDTYVIRRLGVSFTDVNWTSWDTLLRRVHQPEHEVEIALVGKYIDLPDAYLSVTEALRSGGFHHDAKVRIRWVASDECQTPAGAQRALGGVDAVLVPGGFGVRGIEGKLGALRWSREHGVPTLGICLGLQCMVIEHARNVAGIEGASSSEFDPGTPAPVVATMAEQRSVVDGAGDLGGTMRLGSYPARLREGSVTAEAYGTTEVTERHRHRYEVNEDYRARLEETGLVISGTHPELGLVEFVELPREVHPYYVATQAHPEFKSRPDRAHPLFAGLVGAAVQAQRDTRLVEVERPREDAAEGDPGTSGAADRASLEA
ncbi:CTP synthase [Janibacter alkaliphilus]|uniref:CTP synthase n=1 Tax=Janibacter alkaliphilus TaxID=1069963 RepID=UPI0015C6AC33